MSSGKLLTKVSQLVKGIISKGTFESMLSKVVLLEVHDTGRLVAQFKVTPDITNQVGTLHGGFTATLVDCISSLALLAGGSPTPGVSTDLSCSYMKAANVGEIVTVEAQVLKSGKNISFSTVDLKNEQGQLIAQGKHTKFMAI